MNIFNQLPQVPLPPKDPIACMPTHTSIDKASWGDETCDEKMKNKDKNSDALVSKGIAYQSEHSATTNHNALLSRHVPPTTTSTTIGNCKQLTMKEWIAGALNALGEAESDKALCSTAYLTCALKIAHSLADQVCQSEQAKGGEGLSTGHSSWSDCVAIFVNVKTETCYDDNNRCSDELSETLGNIEEKKQESKKETELIKSTFLEPEALQYSHEEEGRQKEENFNAKSNFEPLLGKEDLWPDDFSINESIFDDDFESEMRANEGQSKQDDTNLHLHLSHPIDTRNYKDECREEEWKERDQSFDYLNVSSARLRTEESGHKQRGEMMNIYSLGLVLIELCSGRNGQIQPYCGESVDNSNDGAFETSAIASIFNPPNLASAMNIIDSLGDDDELFGNGGRCTENATACHDPEQAKKRRSTLDKSSVSVEELRLAGIPNSLCDLIDNMIGCSRGDFSNDETYSTMKDVRSDLQSMIKNPDIYLEDLDLDKVYASGLQMDNDNSILFGRDTELASLQQVFHRSMNNYCECAIVSGPAGIGKSQLVNKLIQYATSRKGGCVYLSGKFDKLQQTQPFHAVTSAFNRYCEWLSTSENVIFAEKVSVALRKALGSETYSLAKIVPSLVKIIGEAKPTDGNSTMLFDDPQKRLRFLLCQFLEVICDSHEKPLILSLDDLQSVDKASLAWINQVLLVFGSSRRRLFFLGSCRDDEITNGPLSRMLQSMSDIGITTTKIELGCLDRESVNSFLSHKLKLLPRLTLPLADIIFHKTKGSPFFLEQLVVELCKEGLLRPSLSRRRYVWDVESILERELPSDVVSFITQSISRLPADILSSLETLSCFGSSSDVSLIDSLEREIGLTLSGPLNTAIVEGFLIMKKKQYHFVHARVHEAVYNMIPEGGLCRKHHEYGVALSRVAARNNDDGLFLLAASQLNLGGRQAIADKGLGIQAAKLNLSAGKISMVMADYFSAYWFFDHGISYLPNYCWDIDYDMTIELYDAASECALSNGDHDSLDKLTPCIMNHARCYDHKLNVIYITMRKLIHKGELTAAIEIGINSLRHLGLVFPKIITPEFIIQRMDHVKEMLGDRSNDDLINYRVMCSSVRDNYGGGFEYQDIIMRTKILGRLSEAMFYARPYDQPVIIMKMVELSLEHGFNPLSPLAFALYGSFSASMGDIDTGYRFAKISRILLDKIGSNEIRGEVICYTTQVMAHVEPVQSVADLHSQGYKDAIAAGITASALTNALFHSGLYFFSGEKLSTTKNVIEESMQVMKKHMLQAHLMEQSRTISKLQGTSLGAISDDNSSDIEIELRKNRKMDPHRSKTYSFNEMLSAFMFRQYDRTKVFAIEYSNYNVKAWLAFYFQVVHKFYYGLVSYWIGREDQENSEKWIAKGNESKQALQHLATSCSWNVQNKFYLLCAEEQFCAREFGLAEKYYDMSISSAKEHRFVNEEALANELAGIFYAETGRRKLSTPYFFRAVEKYQQWEAYGKANALKTYLAEVVAVAER